MMGKGYEEKMEQGRDGGVGGPSDQEAKAHHVPVLVWENDGPSRHQRDADFEVVGADFASAIARIPVQHQHHDTTMTSGVQRPLTDPLVNDLDHNSRYYLYHFATQLCEVMVVYDVPGQNPIRELIPATSKYPLLLQIIVANSAFHVFNITRNPMGQSPYQGEQSPSVTAYHQAQALSLLARSVVSVDASNIDLILMTILLFVNYALVESGRDKWKVHMDGAVNLIKLLGKPPYLQQPMSRLRQTILSDLLVFYILGSTFSFTTLPALIPDTIELEPILRYAETNNYLSCPGPLLRIMLESFALPDAQGSPSSAPINIDEQVAMLLQRALDFQPELWSREFQRAAPFDNIGQRFRIASAHRSAVCIYLARVLPSTNPLLDPASGSAIVNLTSLANDVVEHISYLKPGDALFKSVCWPLFLAGAESEDPSQREWIMNTLDELYGQMFWGYLHTSKRVLEEIWRFKDEAGVGAPNCWVEEVKDFGNEILIA
ncbi:hypothetical protein PTNB73_05007 [Pyrenophora teres f. teres]|nr:hypothetical protein PTNB73_05007 [Pyrenophora teres f. teres]